MSTLAKIVALTNQIGDDNRFATSVLLHLAGSICDGSERELAELVNEHCMGKLRQRKHHLIEGQWIGNDGGDTL